MDTIYTEQHKLLIRILQAERKRAGMTQTQLAQRMNMTQGTISQIELGQRRVLVTEFLDLAVVLGFDPEAVMRQIDNVDGSI